MKKRAKLVLPAPSTPLRVSTSPGSAPAARAAASDAVAVSSASTNEPGDSAGMRPFNLFEAAPEASDDASRQDVRDATFGRPQPVPGRPTDRGRPPRQWPPGPAPRAAVERV